MGTNLGKLVKVIEKRKAALSAERDKLDELISEIEALREDTDEAVALLEDARDALSKLV